MKLLFIARFDTKACGPTEVLRNIIPCLVAKGITVNVFSPYAYADEKEQLASDLGAKYYSCKFRILTQQRLHQIIPDINSYDVIHIHGIFEPKNWIISRILAKESIPYVISIHGNLMKNALKKSNIKKHIAIRCFIKKMLTNAQALHALSNAESCNIKLHCDNTVFCIENGVSCINRSLSMSHLKRITTFLYIGRIDIHHKGIDLLLRSIHNLPAVKKESSRFIFAGPFKSKKDKAFFYNHLSDNVEYVGVVYGEDKYKLLSECDFFILTSRYEGMPLAALEALSMGIPIIVTRETNLEDIVTRSSCGYITDFSEKDIEQAINKAIHTTSVERSRLGKNGYSFAITHLSWDTIADQYINMYNTVIETTSE